MKNFLLLFFLSSCILGKRFIDHNTNISSYEIYSNDRNLILNINNVFLSDSTDYDKILYLLNQVKHETHKVYKEMMLSYVYEDTKQMEKSKKHLKKAISLGFYANYIKYFEQERGKYLSKLDTSTIRVLKQINSTDQKARTYNQNISREEYFNNMIHVDSINTHLLDSLVQGNSHKWLGFKEIGNTKYDRTRVSSINSTAVHHMSEIDNHRYFKLIVEACEKDNEYWGCAEGIKWQQLKRFIDSNYNYMKLRHMEFKEMDVNVQDNETLLTINETAKLIKYNYESRYYESVVYPTVLIENENYKLMGLSLMQELKKFGVADHEVTFDPSVVVPMDSLEKIAKNYPFVIKFIEIN